ncbi:MAG: hypothetical protein Kow00121_30980 [Elainellaceae cyanobacterium]
MVESSEQALLALQQGRSLTDEMRSALIARALANKQQACAFGITADNAKATIEQRSRWFQAVYPKLSEFCCSNLGWKTCPIELLWDLWLPLALQIAHWREWLDRPLIQGILGGQGTGKTTLSRILSQILPQLGWRVCSLSIDDLYKTYAERQHLQQSDPRWRWRGPPGTHDVALGLETLRQLRQAEPQPIMLPRFDKSLWNGAGDRTDPEAVQNVDIVLFEGWFVGVRPIDPAQFETAPPPIVTSADRAFAREVNDRLQSYLPLWDQIDRLIVLCPTDYRLSQQWRRQAEQQMIASGKSGMTDEQVNEFVEYFWRSLHPELFISPLLHDPQTDLVIEINANHQPERVYCPGAGCPSV